MSAIVEAPISPFRPPKFPLRSVPKPRNTTLAAATSKHAAAGQSIRVFNTAPLPPAPVHTTPPLQSYSGPTVQPPPLGAGHADPNSGLRGPSSAPRPLMPTTPSQKPSGPAAVGPTAPPPLGLPPHQSKALPIINKHTGQPVVPTPLNPNVMEFEPKSLKANSPSSTPSSNTTNNTTPSAPTATALPAISAASIEARMYTTEEMRSLRPCDSACPETLLKLVLSGELFAGCQDILKIKQVAERVPASPLQEECVRGDVFGGASSALEKTVAVRLRQVKETHQKVMSVLSRLTPEKYEPLKRELLDLPLRQTDEKQLKQVVTVFFEKAVQEPVYSELYASLVANMCHVSESERTLPKEEKDKLFAFRMRRELLNKCQEEFTKPVATSEDELLTLSEAELEDLRMKHKKRLCGNVKFVCELYHRSLVTDRVVDSILTTLINMDSDETYVAEAIATTLNSAGSIFSRSQPEAFDRHMKYCIGLQRTHPSNRIRFMMMDLEDNRKRGFEKRKQVLTQDELDRQQFEDQKKLQEDIDKALREQNRRRKKGTTAPANTNGSPASVASTPSTPNRPSKAARAKEKKEAAATGREDTGSGRFDVPSSPSANNTPMTSPSAHQGPMFGYKAAANGAGSTSCFASTNSLTSLGPATPSATRTVLSKEQVEKNSREMMSALAVNELTPDTVVARFANEFPEKHQRIALVIGWLRRAVATTKLFTEREQLPALFAAFLNNAAKMCGAEGDTSPSKCAVLTAAELAKALSDWIISDIDCQQYDNCPRMFLNWAGVVDGAAKHNLQEQCTDDPSQLLQPGTLNLFLQELRRHSDSSSVEPFLKDVISTCDSATEQNITKTVNRFLGQASPDNDFKPQLNERALAMLQRFRPVAHLAYAEGVQGGCLEDIVAKLLQNPKIKDDLELLCFRSFLQSPIGSIEDECRAHFVRSRVQHPLHTLLKVTSAAMGVLLPFHASTVECEQGNNPFREHPLSNAAPDRIQAITVVLKNFYQKAVHDLAGHVKQALMDISAAMDFAHYLCGIAVLTEAIQHVVFASSVSVDRSVPASPTSMASPVIPLPRSSSTSSVMTSQLEFEQSFAAQLTARVNEVLVVAEHSRFVHELSRQEVCDALRDAGFDFWYVSPPHSLRPSMTSPALGMQHESSLNTPGTPSGSSDDLMTPDCKTSILRSGGSNPLRHSNTLVSSVTGGLSSEN